MTIRLGAAAALLSLTLAGQAQASPQFEYVTQEAVTVCGWELCFDDQRYIEYQIDRRSQIAGDLACLPIPPATPGSYSDHTFTAPADVKGFHAVAEEGAWTTVACRVTPDGSWRFETWALQFGTCGIPPGNPLLHVMPYDCTEDVHAPAAEGDVFVVRSFNQIDLELPMTTSIGWRWCYVPCPKPHDLAG